MFPAMPFIIRLIFLYQMMFHLISSQISILCLTYAIKKSLTDFISVKDESYKIIIIRGATSNLREIPRALSRIPSYPRQLTYASTSQNTLRDTISPAFDCALSGPFDDLFLTRFSASRALCKGMIAVISASSV